MKIEKAEKSLNSLKVWNQSFDKHLVYIVTSTQLFTVGTTFVINVLVSWYKILSTLLGTPVEVLVSTNI